MIRAGCVIFSNALSVDKVVGQNSAVSQVEQAVGTKHQVVGPQIRVPRRSDKLIENAAIWRHSNQRLIFTASNPQIAISINRQPIWPTADAPDLRSLALRIDGTYAHSRLRHFDQIHQPFRRTHRPLRLQHICSDNTVRHINSCSQLFSAGQNLLRRLRGHKYC